MTAQEIFPSPTWPVGDRCSVSVTDAMARLVRNGRQFSLWFPCGTTESQWFLCSLICLSCSRGGVMSEFWQGYLSCAGTLVLLALASLKFKASVRKDDDDGRYTPCPFCDRHFLVVDMGDGAAVVMHTMPKCRQVKTMTDAEFLSHCTFTKGDAAP